MGIATSFAVYFTIWWTVLFTVLPLGVQSYHEAGLEVPGGGEPGAPINPNIRRKFFTTTWISAIVFALVWSAFHFHWITWQMMPLAH